MSPFTAKNDVFLADLWRDFVSFWCFFVFKIFIIFCLAALSLQCGTWGLSCVTWDLLLWCVGSLVVEHGLQAVQDL